MAGADLSARVTTLAAFAGARWGRPFPDRAALLRHQERRLQAFLRRTLPRAPFYRSWAGRPFAELPIVDKGAMLRDFAAFNTRGIELERALAVASEAERSRDFRPTLDGLTVGLSSGTSGTRGVFLVSPRERARWAGLLLARLLSPEALGRLLGLRQPPLRVAFFLRANSNLYETVGGRRLRFAFHDLLEPLAEHLERLRETPPDLLVAPPTVLRRLAEAVAGGELRLTPLQVISVAEVLEADDAREIRAAFGVPVQQVYQCTEGFLGVSCEEGRVHLNEEDLLIEPEWLDVGEQGAPGRTAQPSPEARRAPGGSGWDADAAGRRFQPIVTDFSRTTQLVVRYRLDDVLRCAEDPCPCGRPTRSLEAIEGRADDVLWARPVRPAPAAGDLFVPVFPDLVRRAFALADRDGALRDYRVEQEGAMWRVRLDSASGVASAPREGAALPPLRAWSEAPSSLPSPSPIEAQLRAELDELARRQGLRPIPLLFEAWHDEPLHEKRRRIRCRRKPRIV